MAVLVTGGAGYIGAHIAWALHDRGERVVALDNLSTGRADMLPPTATLVTGDVCDPAAVRRAFAAASIDSVVHCAALTVVPDSLARPLDYYRVNAGGTLEVLAAATAEGVKRIVFSSTAAVYGVGDGTPIAEDGPIAPASPYGASKRMAEQMIADAMAASGGRAVILRYFNVAGADPALRCGQATPRATHLVKVCVEAATGKRDRVTIHGTGFATPDGTGVRDFIHVSDLADAHLRALDHLRSGGGDLTLNCGYGRGHSVKDVIDAARRASGGDLSVVTGPARPGDLGCVIADASRLRAALGWTPRHDSIDDIVAHALAWERRSLAAAPAARVTA